MESCSSLREAHALDLSCIVSRQSRSCVFRLDAWDATVPVEPTDQTHTAAAWSGPVAVKAIAHLTDAAVAPQPAGTVDASALDPVVYEAAMLRLVGGAGWAPRVGIPLFIDCIKADLDATRRLDRLFGVVASSDSDSSGKPYALVVTQFIKAASLSRLFYTFPILPLPVVVATLCQLTHLLATLQSEAGIVYGDLKLTNVLVAEDRGRLWLVDYASSVALSAAGDDAARHILASTTPHVLSPELRVVNALMHTRSSTSSSSLPSLPQSWQRARAHGIALQDVWALGVLCLELLTGQVFQGDVLVDDLVQSVLSCRPCADDKDATSDATACAEKLQMTMDAFRRWVRVTIEEKVKPRYVTSASSSRLSVQDTTLWQAMTDWIVHLLEPDPLLRFAPASLGACAEPVMGQSPASWEAVIDSAFFQHVEACAPSLMRFARESGRRVGTQSDSDDEVVDCWWWSEDCEEEVGDLMLGM